MTRATAGWWRERAIEHSRYGEWDRAAACWWEAARRCQSATLRADCERRAKDANYRATRAPAVDAQWWERD